MSGNATRFGVDITSKATWPLGMFAVVIIVPFVLGVVLGQKACHIAGCRLSSTFVPASGCCGLRALWIAAALYPRS